MNQHGDEAYLAEIEVPGSQHRVLIVVPPKVPITKSVINYYPKAERAFASDAADQE